MTKRPKRIRPYRRWASVVVPTWLVSHTNLSMGAKLAYGSLRRFAGNSDHAAPGHAKWAASLGVKRRQLLRYIQELEALKLIEGVRDFPRKTTYYFLEHELMGHSVTYDTSVVSDTVSHTTPDSVTSGTTLVSHMTPPDPLERNKGGIETGDPHLPARAASATVEGCTWCSKPCTEEQGTHHLLQWCHDRYREAFGQCPTLSPARDANLLSKLAKQHGEEAVKQAYTNYLASSDDFYRKKGWGISTFAGDFDGLRQGGSHGYARRHNRQPSKYEQQYLEQLRADPVTSGTRQA